MYRQYIKQAWKLLKQNKLYSTVYIIGTGLAIAMTMAIAIVYYIRIAPVYPENNRNRMLVASGMKIEYKENNSRSSSLFSYSFVRDHFYTMEKPEAVSAKLDVWKDYPIIEMPGERGMLPVNVMYIDHQFWNVFGFRFLHGKPFTEADFRSAIKTAVISESLAKTLFGTVEAEGQSMSLDGNDFRICGVVADVSYATPHTYAQIWVPYTIKAEDIADRGWGEGHLGLMRVYFLARTPADMKGVKAEVEDIVKKINSSQERYVVLMSGQPDPYWQSVFRRWHGQEIDWVEICKTLGLMVLAMLIIPTVNLAGMVSSRMEKRLSEMGIRKAFGASRQTLLRQLLAENFVLTLLGGLLGLVLSYILVYAGRNWILTLTDGWAATHDGIDTQITGGMLFNPVLFLSAFGICFLLNLLSVIIPAYTGLRKGIIDSLGNNRSL